MSRLKFHSPIFPNLGLFGNGIKIQFENSYYETADEHEIELLKSAGFASVNEVKPVEKPVERKKAK